MLSLQLKSGEYISIGDNIAVQIFELSGSTFRVAVKAPREVPILRGKVLEQAHERPDGLRTTRPKSPSDKARDAKRIRQFEEQRALAAARREHVEREQERVTRELREILGGVDQLGMPPAVREQLQALRTRLESIGAAAE